MKQMLPNGSVIKAKDNDNQLIIIGRLTKNDDYDYICVKYPYGYVDSEDFSYIKRTDVISIVCLGDINY